MGIKMIKRNVNRKLLFLLLLAFLSQYANAQSNTIRINGTLDTELPQWTKDLRRWEIVAFGSFPFTMFFATFGMDMYRFANQGGWQDTRYAPWPLKSAGAVEMTNKEYETTMIVAASLSAVIAFADLIIVQVKRRKAREYAESLPTGTRIITRRPWPLVDEEVPEMPEAAGADTKEETAIGETAGGESTAPADTENPDQGLFGKPQNP